MGMCSLVSVDFSLPLEIPSCCMFCASLASGSCQYATTGYREEALYFILTLSFSSLPCVSSLLFQMSLWLSFSRTPDIVFRTYRVIHNDLITTSLIKFTMTLPNKITFANSEVWMYCLEAITYPSHNKIQ